MKHILEADGIQLAFDNRKILLSIYLKCETGNITGLLGKNGTGKSCLMRIIHSSLYCESSIRIDGKSIKNNEQNKQNFRHKVKRGVYRYYFASPCQI